MEKRTKRGHCGQSTDRSAARGRKLLRGNQERLLLQNTRVGSDLLQRVAAGGAFPDSRAVRALSAVSALCPFLHERRDQPRAESSTDVRAWIGPTGLTGRVRALSALID